MKRCNRCSFVRYCSHDCQKSDWRYHKRECTVLANEDWNYDKFKAGDHVYYGPVDQYTFELTRHRAKHSRKLSMFMHVEINLSVPHKLINKSERVEMM